MPPAIGAKLDLRTAPLGLPIGHAQGINICNLAVFEILTKYLTCMHVGRDIEATSKVTKLLLPSTKAGFTF